MKGGQEMVRIGLIVGVVLAAMLAGCGGTDPYVYKFEEFNRNAKDFNKLPTDRDGVTICYNGVGTTDAQIARMAQNECEKFGKTARLDEETFGDCPMLVPVQARFVCEPPAGVAAPSTEAPSEQGG